MDEIDWQSEFRRVIDAWDDNESYEAKRSECISSGCCGAVTIHNEWIRDLLYENAELKMLLAKCDADICVLKGEANASRTA